MEVVTELSVSNHNKPHDITIFLVSGRADAVILNWQPPSDVGTIYGYKILVSKDGHLPDEQWKHITIRPMSTYILTNLTGGADQYVFKISAISQAETQVFSPVISLQSEQPGGWFICCFTRHWKFAFCFAYFNFFTVSFPTGKLLELLGQFSELNSQMKPFLNLWLMVDWFDDL